MNSMLMRGLMIGLTALSGSLALSAQVVVSSGFEQLDRWASECLAERSMTLGYPGNNDIRLEEFYRWYTGNNLESMIINNAGDPFEEGDHTLSSLDFEREVIQYFAPKYGFDGNDLWGIVTMSGTDGNNHGIYFGVNYLKRKTGKMPVVYVSDAALFGGYLPFTEYKDLVDRRKTGFDSISVSGHKFFGIDSPCGLFITTRDVYDNQSTYDISYLNANMRMINCSRSGIEPLKFWWLMKTVGDEGWTEQAARIFENTRYLKSELKRIGWPYWNNEYSNTVIFRRPSAKVVRKYNLACGEDAAFGGKLSHVVVMQHVTKDSIDRLIADLRNETISDL